MSNQTKAEALFKHYRQNLIAISADPRVKMEPFRDDIVFCPLCFKWFTVDAIQQNILTIEHSPPNSLGGKPITLTCQTCNNDQGSKLDSKLVSFIREKDALAGHGSRYIKGDMKTIDTGKIRIEFRANDAGWELLGVPKASHPEYIKQLKWGTFDKFTLNLEFTHPRKAKLSLIRHAYLIAFAYLGYGFLMNVNLSRIRSQLQQPDDDIFPLNAVIMDMPFPEQAQGINLINRPIAMKSYCIVFDIHDRNSIAHRVAVLLPGPNSNDYDVFMQLDDFEKVKMSFRPFDINFESKLENPFIAHSIWNSI